MVLIVYKAIFKLLETEEILVFMVLNLELISSAKVKIQVSLFGLQKVGL